MFDYIGEKIKGLATVVTWIGIIASVVYGCVLMSKESGELILLGLVVMGVGSLIAWLSSLTLYGFGELIDKVSSVEKLLKKDATVENNKATEETESTENQ